MVSPSISTDRFGKKDFHTMNKEPTKIDSALEVSFDQSEIVIRLVSTNGAPIYWDLVEEVVKELRADFEETPFDTEVH